MCALLPALPAHAGSWQNNVAIGGFNSVNVCTPDTVSTVGNGRALLLVLHGCTQSITAYAGAKLEVAAETHGMVVAVHDAMHKAGFGEPQSGARNRRPDGALRQPRQRRRCCRRPAIFERQRQLLPLRCRRPRRDQPCRDQRLRFAAHPASGSYLFLSASTPPVLRVEYSLPAQ